MHGNIFDYWVVMGTSQYFEARAGSSQTQSGSSRAGLALKGPNFTTQTTLSNGLSHSINFKCKQTKLSPMAITFLHLLHWYLSKKKHKIFDWSAYEINFVISIQYNYILQQILTVEHCLTIWPSNLAHLVLNEQYIFIFIVQDEQNKNGPISWDLPVLTGTFLT